MTDRRLRRDIAWNVVPVALLGGVGLGLNFLIGGWWGPAALGVFNQVTAAFFVFAVLGAGGLQYAVLRAVAEAPDDADRVAAVVVGALVPTLVLGAATTVIFVAVRGPVADWLDSPQVGVGMLWAAPGLVCFVLNKVLLNVVNGLRRMRAFAVYTSLRYALIAVGLVGARLAGVEPEHLPGIWAFAEGCVLVVLGGELVATVSLRRCRGWTRWAREHLVFGARGLGATLAYEINQKLDVWLLGVALSDERVGVYSLAAALAEGALQLAVVLQNNLNPLIARELAGGNVREVEQLVRRARRWFVPAFVAICAVAAATYPLIVPWLIGKPEFVDGAAPFAILMAGIALCSAYLPFHHLLMMAARPGSHTLFVTLVLGVNATANLILVPRIGLSGAAIASALAYASSALLLRIMVRWRVGVRI